MNILIFAVTLSILYREVAYPIIKFKYFLLILGAGILCLFAYYQLIVALLISGVAFILFLNQLFYHQSKPQQYAIITSISLYLVEFTLVYILRAFGMVIPLRFEQLIYSFFIEFHLFYLFYATLYFQNKVQFRNEK
ncbi:hypothetical protein BAU15_08270 [Enterococcus sp. JM4C]|uniref:hypothetical protein n=1 Tax=Candidatus Enterococcus huntleyi TaxID=1857217 RepID=UPI00137A4E3C|nr:hypothetical protein [Enterococcus sp. JM4C]KAF1297890.1 hypothetical protein BAU15_08270 [Enterococcus sp. JM4C]